MEIGFEFFVAYSGLLGVIALSGHRVVLEGLPNGECLGCLGMFFPQIFVPIFEYGQYRQIMCFIPVYPRPMLKVCDFYVLKHISVHVYILHIYVFGSCVLRPNRSEDQCW